MLSAMKATGALSGLMPNIEGLSQWNRVLPFLAVSHSKLLYASSVWAMDGVKKKRKRRTLNKAQGIYNRTIYNKHKQKKVRNSNSR